MIDFATLKALIIPEGVVTKITNTSGNVLWELNNESDIISLEVEKITSDTYANSTTYSGESFILLGISPKTNGTVNITYGGLTKTIVDTSGEAKPTQQTIFFGTFNGVSDSVETPLSGTLEITGDYRYWSISSYNSAKSQLSFCSCITRINSFGKLERIGNRAFYRCTKITSITIPDSVTSIEDSAFSGCSGLTSITIPDGVTSIEQNVFTNCSGLTSITIPDSVTSIEDSAFSGCSGLTSITIPDSVTSIINYAFYNCTSLVSANIGNSVVKIESRTFQGCTALTQVSFENTSGWYVADSDTATSGTSVDVTNLSENANMLVNTYVSYYWFRS